MVIIRKMLYVVLSMQININNFKGVIEKKTFITTGLKIINL